MFKEVRRAKNHNNKHQDPVMGLSLPKGEFYFYTSALELIQKGKKKDIALMFYINEKEKKVRFDYEKPEVDNYHLNSSSSGYSRFTSKDLGVEFANLFDLDMEGKHYFLV